MGFAQRINELRKENGLTQKQFADELNLSTTTVASWEKEVKKPSFEVLILISEKFNVSLDWLCETRRNAGYSAKIPDIDKLKNKIEEAVEDFLFEVGEYIDSVDEKNESLLIKIDSLNDSIQEFYRPVDPYEYNGVSRSDFH